MYELINTSVPNGLIAGTHGFATVAMTKGMPDAIRQRVENFCAYPHRTSAHDASYYSENPINWFHLRLPNGDRVAGCTAATEFDYTGRTNRMSHLLCFGANEIPHADGMWILESEKNRFAQNWFGQPRFLAAEEVPAMLKKKTCARGAGDAPHWLSFCGPEGERYARQFAALLIQNIRTGKSIYFKTSAAIDRDGGLLRGLFTDLINLVSNQDDELAAQVTFATFAACVPDGVACHLRGIYDTDRAFKVASALQPWVDCENCCVKHPEMLPEVKIAILPRIVRPADEGIKKGLGRPYINVWDGEKGSARPSNYSSMAQSSREKPSSRSRLMIAVVVMAVLGCCCVAGYRWYAKTKRYGVGEKITERICRQEISKWHLSQTNEITSLRNSAQGYNDSADIESVKNDVERRESQLESDFQKHMKDATDSYSEIIGDNAIREMLANVCRQDAEKSIEDCRNKCKELIGDLGFRIEELNKHKEEHSKKEKEKNAFWGKSKDEVSTKIRNLKGKQPACKHDEGTKMVTEKSLKELRITKDIKPDENWLNVRDGADRIFPDEKKRKLTRKGSIVIWYYLNNSCKRISTELGQNKTSRMNNGEPVDEIEYAQPQIDLGDSPWEIIYVVVDKNEHHVFWRWRNWPTETIFADGMVNKDKLIRSCFGSEKDVFDLWQQYSNGQEVFLISPVQSDVGYEYLADIKSEGDVIKTWESSRCSEGYKKKIKKLDDELKNVDSEKKKCDKKISQVRKAVRNAKWNLTLLTSMKTEEKRQKVVGGKTKEQKLKDDIEKEIKPWLKEIGREFNKAAIKQGIDDVERQLTVCRHPGNHLRSSIQGSINELESWKENLMRELRSATYKIQILKIRPSGFEFGWNKITRQKSKED